jgi:predicted  nucleic acid-binding Zn-ribbon protein
MVAGRSDPNGYSEGLGKVGESIFRFKQSRRAEEERQRNAARQAELDRMNAEDRQRRIQAEDRQQKLYGETASLIRSRKEERARLVNRRNEIAAKIAEIESRLK